MNDKIYKHKPEIWDKQKCEKIVKRKQKDTYGTQDHIPGFIKEPYGIKEYNGGCVINKEWYAGEYFPFPTIPNGFKIIYVSTWWFRLIKIGETG